jgi:sec-independent protein translocase protein TatA
MIIAAAYPLAFLDSLGGSELILIFLVVLLLFGGQKLPELARGLGKSVREFKKATAGVEEEIKKALEAPAEVIPPKVEPPKPTEPKNPFVVPPSQN